MSYVRFFIFLFAFLAYGMYWYSEYQNNLVSTQSTTDSKQANYTLLNANKTSFDEKGQMSNQLTAEKLEHFEKRQVTMLTQPQYKIYSKQRNSTWLLTAQKGTLQHQSDILYLKEKVHLSSLTYNEPISSLKTKALNIDLKTNTLHSNEDVTIEGDTFIIHGTGIKANLESELIEISSNIQGTYETP